MLQAMNTGHDGSLATIHANSPRDALSRLETMVSMAGLNIPDKAIRHQITSAIHVIIQLARLSDGSRKMMNLFETRRHGRGHDHHAGDFCLRNDGGHRGPEGQRPLHHHRHPPQIHETHGGHGHQVFPPSSFRNLVKPMMQGKSPLPDFLHLASIPPWPPRENPRGRP